MDSIALGPIPFKARMTSESRASCIINSPMVEKPSPVKMIVTRGEIPRSSRGISKAVSGMAARNSASFARRASSTFCLRSTAPVSTRLTKRDSSWYSSGVTRRPSAFLVRIPSTCWIISTSSAASSEYSGSSWSLYNAFVVASGKLLISILQVVSLAASRAFWPSRPIARLS